MATSSRFALGVHILALLAVHRDTGLNSQAIAASASTNPAFVRRILARFNKAGLTTSQPGKGGGSRLAKGPKKISLLDIYEAVDAGKVVAGPKQSDGGDCKLASAFPPVFENLTRDAETAFFDRLSETNLKQVLKGLNGAAKA